MSQAFGFLAAAVVLVTRVIGAGMNTHTMIGHRTVSYYGNITTSPNSARYNDAIRNQLEAYIGGSDFPDFLYAYKNATLHNAAEAAHWPPFQAAAIRYIRKQPGFSSAQWDTDMQQLVAFVFGMSTHYMADETWEGLTGELGHGQGFVRQLGTFNMGHRGESGADESAANFGGDFYVSLMMQESQIKPWSRYFPIDHLVKIYAEYNMSFVAASKLKESQLLFDLGLWAEKTFGGVLYDYYTEHMKHLPLVEERVVDMPIGGIDDMAVYSGMYWERIARWMDQGPPSDPSPRVSRRSVSQPQGAGTMPDEGDLWISRFTDALRSIPHTEVAALMALEGVAEAFHMAFEEGPDGLPTLHFDSSPLLAPFKGSLLAVLKALLDAVMPKDQRQIRQQFFTVQEHPQTTEQAPMQPVAAEASTISGSHAVGYLGRSLSACDLDGDGLKELAAGAYGAGERGNGQAGQVVVRYAGGAGATITLNGDQKHARFGWSLACLDFNQDGIDDLVVGAPSSSDVQNDWGKSDSEPGWRVWGKVHVYFGKKDATVATEADMTIFTDGSASPQAGLPNGELTYLGDVLAVGDVDRDGHADLLIGAPFRSASDSWPDYGVNQGMVAAFLSSKTHASGDRLALNQTALHLHGPAYSWFGQSMAVADEGVLLVGAPGLRQPNCSGTDGGAALNCTVGGVYAYDLKPAAGSVEATLLGWWEGEEGLAEFGHALALQGGANTETPLVAVASPAAGGSSKALPILSAALRGGEVRLISTARTHLPVGRVPVSKGSLMTTLVGQGQEMRLGRLGYSLSFGDINGDGVGDLTAAAPLSSGWIGGAIGTTRERGSVFVFDGKKLPTGVVTDVARSATWHMDGSVKGGRLGFAVAELGGGVLAVGSPRAPDAAGENAGAVKTWQALPAEH